MISKSMKIITILIMILIFAVSAFCAEKTETLTFAWEHNPQANEVPITFWQMDWAVTAGGPYAKLGDIAYQDAVDGSYQSPVVAVVTGQPGTHETRYFILRACGDMPQEDGSTIYECSDPSNEVSYAFWIEPSGFSAPVQFRIIAE